MFTFSRPIFLFFIINIPFKQVDMKKVNLNVIKPWIANKIVEILGFEDEVVIDFAFGLLEEEVLVFFFLFNFSVCDNGIKIVR